MSIRNEPRPLSWLTRRSRAFAQCSCRVVVCRCILTCDCVCSNISLSSDPVLFFPLSLIT